MPETRSLAKSTPDENGPETGGRAPRGEVLRAARTIVIGLGLVLAAWLLLEPLVHYFAIVFCGVLLALAISSAASAMHHRVRVPYRAGVAIVVVAMLGLVTAFFAWTGPQLAEQFVDLDDEVRRGVASAREQLNESQIGRAIDDRISELDESVGAGSGIFGWLQRGISGGMGMIADTGIVLVLAVFLAMSPLKYAGGALMLVPRERRERIREVGTRVVHALRTWLAARVFLMFVIGIAFGLGLWALGVPLALPIAVLTGLLSFIPFIGAVLALLPAVAVALLQGPEKALHVVILYVAIQLIETNIIDPLVEARAVRLPPALMVVAQLIAGVWFGPIGILIATPMLVVIVIATQMLYVEDRLGERLRKKVGDKAREPERAEALPEPT